MILVATWPPKVAVILTRSRFAFGRLGMTSDSRRAPFTTDAVCATLAPPTVGVTTTFALAAGCRLSERITRNETIKSLPATARPEALAGPMIGLTAGCRGRGDAGGSGLDAVTTAVLLVGLESGIS